MVSLRHKGFAAVGVPVRPVRPTQLPLHTDWAWHPSLDPITSDGIQIFQSGPKSALSLAYCPHSDSLHIGAAAQVSDFASLALNLPKTAHTTLSKSHILRVDASLTVSRPLVVFARLNMRHGPDTHVYTLMHTATDTPLVAEFDLAATAITERPLHHMWIDLIFERPQDTRIEIANLSLSRRPRAEV